MFIFSAIIPFKLKDTKAETVKIIEDFFQSAEDTEWLMRELLYGPTKLDWNSDDSAKYVGPLVSRLVDETLLGVTLWKSNDKAPNKNITKDYLPQCLTDFIQSIIKKATNVDIERCGKIENQKIRTQLAKVFVNAGQQERRKQGVPPRPKAKIPKAKIKRPVVSSDDEEEERPKGGSKRVRSDFLNSSDDNESLAIGNTDESAGDPDEHDKGGQMGNESPKPGTSGLQKETKEKTPEKSHGKLKVILIGRRPNIFLGLSILSDLIG